MRVVTEMMTTTGLRRSDGVDDDCVDFRSAFSCAGPELGGEHCLTWSPDDDTGDLERGEDDDRRRNAEMCRVRLRDDKSSAVQDACDEAPTSKVAVRPLRRQLYTSVRLSVRPSQCYLLWGFQPKN